MTDLRITDARTGRRTEIRPRHAGLLRMTVHVGQPGRPFGLGDLRTMLAGDLFVRTAESDGVQVVTELSLPAADDGQVRALLRDADLLGIRPPADTTSAAGSAAELHIAAQPGAVDAHAGALLATVGPVIAPVGEGSPAGAGPLGSLPLDGPDGLDGLEPLAVRLALLGHAHQEPARLTVKDLAEAQKALTRWRTLVAELARAPSRPLIADLVRAAYGGLADDLDAAPALRALHDLESRAEWPEGARFETYLRVDQVLALELGREIGRR